MSSQQDVIAGLPKHLQPFIAVQDYSQYTSRDHAIWRFLLHQLKFSLADSAHPTYFEGLSRTGIGLEAIPKIENINAHLNKLGWQAVAVDGFLPPAVFMEFQARKVLAIALNIRAFEHMLYTPAPDIIHESAGHAPFLIDIDYAEFLQAFGDLGMRAIANQHDMDIYEAVRQLSIVKELTNSSQQDIDKAQHTVEQLQEMTVAPSEANLLARLHWWTVEYGLVGELQDYKIYGAGLLSSLSESQGCMDDSAVNKHPLTINSVLTSYDITKPQPQLFVTESCRHLSQVLADYGHHMCYSRGGASALNDAKQSGSVNTACYNSGIQLSGKLSRVVTDAVGNAIYLNTDGPTQLCYEDTELSGHGIDYHAQGFGSPIGKLRTMERCLSAYTVDELKRHGIEIGQQTQLKFLSGVTVIGKLTSIVRRDQKNILFTFENCTVTDVDDQVLFDPSWGVFDMAVGNAITSVFGGSADQVNFPMYEAPSQNVTAQQNYDDKVLTQFGLYQELRELRELSEADQSVSAKENDRIENAVTAVTKVTECEDCDWLLSFEALELAINYQLPEALQSTLRTALSKETGDAKTLIDQGLSRLGC